MQQILEGLYLFADTCNVYILQNGDQAVLIDFGAGDVLEALPEIGVMQVAAVLMTHHHRDQGQGLARAAVLGIPIYVPHAEQELFHSVEPYWQGREVFNNYNVRQDRFSLIESVPVAGTLRDYQSWQHDGYTIQVLPTPGHTPGAVSLVVQWRGTRLALCGDLLYCAGKLWSLSAQQWTYNGAEGVPATILSLLDLKERELNLLLPSHGEPVAQVASAVDTIVDKLWRLLRIRGDNPRLFQLREHPYEAITPHLLKHRCSMANAYVLLSESGKALVIDAGYDFVTGPVAGADRAGKRPWLYTLPALKQQYGVSRIDVVLPTHYHDDHVAGMNLLRDIEGTQTWVANNFADVLENPRAYDLPCLWYEPIPVDRRMPLEQAFQWEEYTITLYPLPGHTLYAVGILLEVDGKRVLFSGDQYQKDNGSQLNYVFQNHYRIGDYRTTASLYRRLHPDVILSGHWQPLWVSEEYLDSISEQANKLEDLLLDLLPDEPHLGAAGFVARIMPYQASGRSGQALQFTVEVLNPYQTPAEVQLQVVVPQGWQVDQPEPFLLEQGKRVTFCVLPPAGAVVYRARIAVDVTMGGQRFGQQAEALVTLEAEGKK
jgi:glyoxylase-like metal-dependent hydrolase (beta-lactamase superfamily II)